MAQGKLLLATLRSSYALMRAGTAGLKGSVKLLDSFLGSLAGKTELASSERLDDVLDKLPRGLTESTVEAVTEGERLPERMISAFRRHRSRGEYAAD